MIEEDKWLSHVVCTALKTAQADFYCALLFFFQGCHVSSLWVLMCFWTVCGRLTALSPEVEICASPEDCPSN